VQNITIAAIPKLPMNEEIHFFMIFKFYIV
jgi:hypothetical protein